MRPKFLRPYTLTFSAASGFNYDTILALTRTSIILELRRIKPPLTKEPGSSPDLLIHPIPIPALGQNG